MDVRERALKLLAEHGLDDWRVEMSTRATVVAGRCFYDIKTIRLSAFVLAWPQCEIDSLIAHEVAHALVGEGHAHDAVWRAKAIELGDSGEIYYRTVGAS